MFAVHKRYTLLLVISKQDSIRRRLSSPSSYFQSNLFLRFHSEFLCLRYFIVWLVRFSAGVQSSVGRLTIILFILFIVINRRC